MSVIVFLCYAGFPNSAISQQKENADNETIALPLKEEPFAVFVYRNNLWLIADNSAHILLDELRNNKIRSVRNIKQIPSQQAKIFLFSLNDNFSAYVEKSLDNTAIISLHHGISKPSQILTPYISNNDDKQSFLDIKTTPAKDIISVTEPETGEVLQVIPTSEAGSGFYPARSFIEFNIFQSAQGLVIQKSSDSIEIKANNNVVEISSPIGLKLSPEIIEQLSDYSEKENTGKAKTIFPYLRWKLSDNKYFVPTQIRLFHDIAYGDMDAANKARLRLLEIYMSQGLFAESIGMSNDILRTSYKFFRANRIGAIRGAAYFFMQHIEEAAHDFAATEFDNDQEIAIWRTLCQQELGDKTANFNFTDNYDHYISKYPPSFIQKLAILAANSGINKKNYDNALSIFNIIVKNNLDDPINRYIEYMRGKIFSETGNEEEAGRIWEKQAAMIDDPLIRASAQFSLTNMLVREDKIAAGKAINQLEKLLIVWRGDSLELNILTLLGNLYLEEKRYSDALRILRDIVRYYPQSPQTIATSQKMEEIFVNLYNKNGANNMPPLDALALFYEFRDLVPNGKDGDMMIRNLADRLVGIDLLDRAEALLDHQVQKRLQGSERSRVGAHLASIYLQNHQPKDALNTLKNTGYGDLPADLQLNRLRLTAQALSAEGHSDRAIDVLNSDNSPEGTLLRLNIYWNNKDWPNVTLSAEEILSNRNDPSSPLTTEESGVLLKLATAYVYEHDNGQIQYLRDYFTPLLKDNPDKQSFLFITSESGIMDYENLANIDADINTVKSFLNESKSAAKK